LNGSAARYAPKCDGKDTVGKKVAEMGEFCVAFCCHCERLRHPEMFRLVGFGALHGRVVHREQHRFEL
jgi:hypothetical protein